MDKNNIYLQKLEKVLKKNLKKRKEFQKKYNKIIRRKNDSIIG